MRAKTINFERNQEPKESMDIGLWKPYKDVFVTLDEFKDNGGILTSDRVIYNSNGAQIGFWIGYDKNQQVDLMAGGSWKSFPIPRDYGVKIKAKVIYR